MLNSDALTRKAYAAPQLRPQIEGMVESDCSCSLSTQDHGYFLHGDGKFASKSIANDLILSALPPIAITVSELCNFVQLVRYRRAGDSSRYKKAYSMATHEEMVKALNDEFERQLSEMKPHVLQLQLKSERQRCALWIKKVSQENDAWYLFTAVHTVAGPDVE